MEKQGYRELIEQFNILFPGRVTITVKEAANCMSTSERAVRDAIKRQKNPLPSCRLGGRVLIPITSFARWLV